MKRKILVLEDEENIRWMHDEFGAEILPVDAPAAWNITGNLLAGEDFPVYRFLPHRTKGEGFFLAVLRKPEGETVRIRYNPLLHKERKKRVALKLTPEHLRNNYWLHVPGSFRQRTMKFLQME